MACVEAISSKNADSEMEEGEIVDGLSDICSEEEIVRERIEFLEKFNNVLERKKARRTSVRSGKHKGNSILQDLSEISATEFEDSYHPNADVIVYRKEINYKSAKSHHKPKRKSTDVYRDISRSKEKRKPKSRKKPLKVISESSEDSDDEYRNKRRKLAYAVIGHRVNNDKTSLQERLKRNMHKSPTEDPISNCNKDNENEKCTDLLSEDITSFNIESNMEKSNLQEVQLPENSTEKCQNIDLVDLCTDDDIKIVENDKSQDIVDSLIKQELKVGDDSDEDLEVLRQHALKTKFSKAKPHETKQSDTLNQITIPTTQILSEDMDIDTAELRLICLKSALLKRKVERKQRQKKMLLQTPAELREELFKEQEELMERIVSDNNTDIESVDMEIGSDADEKLKDVPTEDVKTNNIEEFNVIIDNALVRKSNQTVSIDDALEEDEDLLRAKLLTSLSKNLPNLIDHKAQSKTKETKGPQPATVSKVITHKETPFVISVGEYQSEDSEVDDETTKNLTKMHHKLSAETQPDFQLQLDKLLKSTRREVENTTEVKDKPAPPKKPPQKIVSKAVSNLPKGEQIEYRKLIKRMAELEKIKQARQSSMNMVSKQAKDTLKPRNVSYDSLKSNANLEQQIALSRKHIAEESAKMMKIKEEGMKLAQKYKIVANELKNIATAITLNKKEQKTVNNRLSKIRLQHQNLLRSTSTHSKTKISSGITTLKLQKENNPAKEHNNEQLGVIKLSKGAIDNDVNVTAKPSITVTAQVNVSGSNRPVKVPAIDRKKDIDKSLNKSDLAENSNNRLPIYENGEGDRTNHKTDQTIDSTKNQTETDDYQSPLQAFGNASWKSDPNAILCPFEVDGDCKDPDCLYLHPKLPIQQ